jgi:hypothetical protein
MNLESYRAKEAPRRLANELASVDDQDVAESGPIGLVGSAVPDIPIAVVERFGPAQPALSPACANIDSDVFWERAEER